MSKRWREQQRLLERGAFPDKKGKPGFRQVRQPVKVKDAKADRDTGYTVSMPYRYTYTYSAADLIAPSRVLDMAKVASLATREPRMVAAPIPDLVVPIVGWRSWSVKRGQLEALGVSGEWKPRQPIEANCSRGQSGLWIFSLSGEREHVGPAPDTNCECGIWAFKTLENLQKAVNEKYEVKVLGEVYLWGRVIETENGFRAQYAYPKDLWLLDETLEHLGYTYNVPIRTV